jgi:hypothetical protein
VKKILISLAYAGQFVLWHLPVSIIALIGLYFVFALAVNGSEDSLRFTNYAFAIVGALSSITFGYSRAVEEKQTNERIQYCGERFLHSAINLLVASVMKYFLLQETAHQAFLWHGKIFVIVSLFSGFLYLSSLINGIAALRELNTLLYNRKKPGKELIKFV